MTGVDKILVIIVLIFSVVFVIAAVGGFAKQMGDNKDKDDQIEELKSTVAKRDGSVSRFEGENNELKKENRQLRDEIDASGGSDASLTNEIKTLKAKLESKEEELERKAKEVNELTMVLKGVEGNVKELTEKFDDMTKANQDLQKEKAELDSKINHYESVEKPNLEKEIKDLKIKIARNGGDTIPPGDDGPVPPKLSKLSCQVLDVRRGEDGYDIAGLNKGSLDGLYKNVKLYVWNSAKGLKGVVTIIEINENTSIVRIDWEEEGKKIESGDTATVQDF